MELLRFCRANLIDFHLFSRQFKPIVLGQLDRLPPDVRELIPDAHVHAIEANNVAAILKGVLMHQLALSRHEKVIAAGDSEMDLTMFSPYPSSLTAFMVLEGTKLEAKLRKGGVNTAANGVPVLPFKNCLGMLEHIAKINEASGDLGLSHKIW